MRALVANHTAADRVRQELAHRKLSVREAARLVTGDAYVTNDTWGRFLNTGELGDKLTRAIAAAFGWPLNWPDEPPPLEVRMPVDDPYVVNLTERLDRLEARQERLIELLERLLRDDLPPATRGDGPPLR
jgi:hypothetical protein